MPDTKKKRLHLEHRQRADYLIEAAKSQSTYVKRIENWHNRLLEQSEVWGITLRDWDDKDVISMLQLWADDEGRK